MPPSTDDYAKTEREILLLVRSDVQNLTKVFGEFVTEQKCCNHDMELRVRTIEISGSKEATDAVKRVESVETRMDAVEKVCTKEFAGESAVKSFLDTTWAKASMLIGAALGVIALIREIWK